MSADANTFVNPVIPGFHPDPSVCRVGADFYLVTSSFEYFPGIPLFHSRDLVSWTQIGHCLTRESQLDLTSARSSQGVFAPTIRWHDGRFYVTATNVSGRGHFIIHTEDPRGEWSDPVWIDQDGIDPSLFFEDDIVYFQSTVEPEPGGEHDMDPDFERGIQQCLVDPMTGVRLSPSRFLWAGSGGRFPEAPHLYRREGWYYLIAAEGGTEANHMVTVARARSPWGPFESNPVNPVLSHRSVASPIQSTGHADLVELADGSWWAVLLGTRPVQQWHHLGRETFLTPVRWSADGWPELGVDGRVLLEHRRPFPPIEDPVTLDTHDDFGESDLGPHWNTLRRPGGVHLSLIDRPGWLSITGRPGGVDAGDLSAVLRRQQHLRFAAATFMDADPGEGESGLLVRMDERHHAELATRQRGGERVIVFRRQVGDLVVEQVAPAPTGPIVLEVTADDRAYTFSWRLDQVSQPVVFPPVQAKYLSSQVAGGFTGVYLGVYSAGQDAVAAFDWFDYQGEVTSVRARASGLATAAS
jgi:xylan 1,4-beta-xylosidase